MICRPPPTDQVSRFAAMSPSCDMNGEPASPHSEPSTHSLARSKSLPPGGFLPSSLPPSSMPELSNAPRLASDAPVLPLPSYSTPGRVLPSLHSSASDRLSPHHISTNLGHEHTTPVHAAGILELRGRVGHGRRAPCEIGAPDTVGVDPSDHGPTHSVSDGDLSTDNDPLSQQEEASEATFAPRGDEVDNMRRHIDIVIPGDRESTQRAEILIDSGAEVNCISRKVVERLGLTPSGRKLSFLKLVLNMLTPWTKRAKNARKRSKERIRGFDGKHIAGQGDTVDISWYGRNKSQLSDPLVWFRPVRYETTHVIIDGDCAAEVLLGWKEVSRLGLRDTFISPIQRPPTPAPDPGNIKYDNYEQRKAKKKAIRDEQRGNSQDKSSGTVRANETGK